MTIFRESDRSLTFTVQEGQFDTWTHALTRRQGDAVKPGTKVRRPGVTFEVLTTTPDGEPVTTRMTLDKPADDPAFVFVVWDEHRYKPFVPPPLSEAV